ncbi:uncharacterized protein LOC129764659 isoform X2 [Toxorhynchites rutilus septentrionalis]|nr:uncharacterized protein LOC129764659 isoform X2 [Toxorhynchites rutilus septentrionalis]XP_055619948.1 uncharacterized protein LOC129764659 isoform X2 [Toxorhynchites rutilus septentrionalis]
MEATDQSHKSRWHGTKQCESPNKQSPPNTAGNTDALAPSTPRIDISRASSRSSHHDSRDSSPENVFEQVGTGTLQDSGVLGYREEGAMDLRSSTEELQFLEPGKRITEKEMPQAPRCSPVVLKLDDQQQVYTYHQRKDSASSEVASFLCISGRTSRISSVGSQGSANSKLSAISGISRSPSPHRMLLETSFCGPKPLQGITDGSIPSSIEPSTAKMLEQVILSRKRDPTEAVLAEGVNVDVAFSVNNVAKSNTIQETEIYRRKSDSNANISRKEEMVEQIQTSRSISNKRYFPPKDLCRPIIGVMPSGTEYIRIKLKPDHCYSDNGIADNERILDEDQGKPNYLKLENACERGVQREEPSVSPKSIHQAKILRENGSRSPSPANTILSRKSSLCSILKLRDSTSPDSPGTGPIRKKSATVTMHEFRGRSRSKSRERDHVSLSNTPNKQKSVLAIFKPKKNGEKSKSPSPVDSNPHGPLHNISNVEFRFNNEQQSSINSRPNLKYYDTPLDGKSIHIPLHTPPEEKQLKSVFVNSAPKLISQSKVPEKVSPSTQSMKLINNCIVTLHNRPNPMPPLKCYRIENADGSITIPLKSPIEEKEQDSLWSMEVQRNSSQDSHDAITSSMIIQNGNVNSITDAVPMNTMKNGVVAPNTSDNGSNSSTVYSNTNNEIVPQCVIANMSAKEKKRLLFSTKMGIGSEEQVFTTQFSISKTESQCSQLSETMINEQCNVDTADIKDQTKSDASHIVFRNKQIDTIRRRNQKERFSRSDSTSGDVIDSFRHSRYIGDSEQIIGIQQKMEIKKHKNEPNTSVSDDSSVSQDTSRDECTVKMSSATPNVLNIPEQRSSVTHDEQALSSESEKDSEMDSTITCTNAHSNMLVIEDHESAGLVLQESFDDELPYIPTTLPEERSVGVKLVPMKERAQMEMKTCPLERPRSTTPIHPASLENFCGITNTTDDPEGTLVRGEKLRISLPKKHDVVLDRPQKIRSPRKTSISSGKNWFEFGEQSMSCNNQTVSNSNEDDTAKGTRCSAEEPPPLPPRKTATSQQWIDFESIPEKRKLPKRITIHHQKEQSMEKSSGVLYNYVKPEECQCECHEIERDSSRQPLLQQDDTNKRCDDVESISSNQDQGAGSGVGHRAL